MRPIERIDNFLSKVDWGLLLRKRWKLNINIDDPLMVSLYKNTWDILYWKENPDQRIGQVLINLGLIPDSVQAWNDEESDILEAQGLAPEEYLFWGSYYDKDMNRIPLVYRLIKDLDSDHINKIYDHMFNANKRLSTEYMTGFKNVLLSRNEYIDHIQAIEDWWKKEQIMEIRL